MRFFVLIALFLTPVFTFAQESVSTTTSAYANNLKMREERRVGVGVQAGGTAGLLGLLLELNIEDQDGTLIGAGFDQGYSTFSISWKHNFEGEYFTPYTTLGWSRWFSSSGDKKSSNYILDEMLTDSEKREGRFGLDFIVAAGGVQYQQLEGDFAGTGFFGEINLLGAPFRGKVLPAAAIGATYFF